MPACDANRPLSVLEIHGTADSVVPYNGRPGTGAGSVMSWLGGWLHRDGCPSSPHTQQLSARVARLDWSSCRGGATVEHLRLTGAAHAWPGADPPDDGPDLGVSAADETWAFLQNRRRG
jgi:polyhydroxybutyrate depolymerase